MTTIAVTCLGSGAALGEDRFWSSLLLDDRILLGCPPTVVPQLYRLKKDPTVIDYIFISHRHADHFFGLPFFLLLYAYFYKRENPLYIVGPSGMERATTELYDLAWPDLRKQEILPRVVTIFVEVSDEGTFEAGDLSFHALKMTHFDMEAYGYRFNYNGREIAFTGDTGECPQLDRLVEGADLVITEFTHAFHSEDPGHLDANAVSRLIKRLGEGDRKPTILATHLAGHPEPIVGLTICHDGETYLV
jgi:ribonuclease BN (tRNA processing enzyme)